MMKMFLILFFLSACTGGSLTNVDGTGSGAVGEAPTGIGGPVNSGQASGDGVLGSQSSSADIEVGFYRDYALDFEPEAYASYTLVERPMLDGDQAFGQAKVRKISGTTTTTSQAGISSSQNYAQVNPAMAELGHDLSASVQQVGATTRWIRTIHCGNFSDEAIGKLIPPEDQSQSWAQNKLLWFVLNLPRPNLQGQTECLNPTYRDFPIGAEEKVDLSALAAVSQDILLFSQVWESDFAKAGPLSTSGEAPLNSAQWLELAKRPKLRIVRLLPYGEMIRIHKIPKAVLTVAP